MNLRIVMLLMTVLKMVFDYRKEDLEQLWEHGRQEDLEVQL